MTDVEKARAAGFLRYYKDVTGFPLVVHPHMARELRRAGIAYGWAELKMLPEAMVEGR